MNEMASAPWQDNQKPYRENYRKNRKIFMITAIPNVLMVIFLLVISSQIKKAGVIIQEDIKNNTIHDTVFVQAPKIYNCWQCKKELSGVNKGSVKCCGFEYVLKNGELLAKKLEE